MVALLIRACIDIGWSSLIAACFAGHCEDAPRLRRIAARESSMTWMGVHSRDAWASGVVWKKAVATGMLQPRTCAWHRREAGPWSTSGSFGMMRGYALRHIGCVPPQLLDVPLVGAVAAARRMRSRACGASRRCRSWRGGEA